MDDPKDMNWREIKPKIAVSFITVRSSLATSSFPRTPSPLLRQISPKNSQNPIFCIFHSNFTSNKYQYAFLPIKPFTTLQRFGPLLSEFIGCSSTALHIFDEKPHRKRTLENMRFVDVVDYVNHISAKPNLETARKVHSLVLKVGVLAHLPTSTSLLITYSRAGDFGSSVALFSDVEEKDVIAWNAMMTMCIENKKLGFVMNLFFEMRERGNSFDSGTLVIAMSAVSSCRKLKQGRILHGLSVKAGMLLDLFLCNSIIDMYAKCGDLCSSENMFESVQYKDPVSWNSVISGCLCNKSPEKSLKYFRNMISTNVHDVVSLSCAVAASTCLGELDIGQVIHGYIVKLGYAESSSASINNAIISFYSECGYPEAAERVFRGMVRKDIVSWNSMLYGFASNEMIFEAFELLLEMQVIGLMQPDSVTVITLLPLCAESMLFLEGRSIHAYVIKRDTGSYSLVVNSLMDFYLKCGSIKTAEYLFNTMPVKDLVSWNTIISGYAQSGHHRKAQTLFKELIFGYSQFSLSTLLAILPSCCSPDSLEVGKSIHSWQLKLGFSNDTLAINASMFMYINCGDFKASFSLLSSVYDVADVASWNTLITACTQKGYFAQALETFMLMRKFSANHDRITLVNVISACGYLGLAFEGKLLHGVSLKSIEGADVRVQNALITMYGQLWETESAISVFFSSHERNLCSWNCIISALSQNKDGKRVLELFRSLNIEPNEITISCILSACTQLGLLWHGKEIHAYVFRFSFQTNPYIAAALVDTYSNCGRLDKAIQVFQTLSEKSIAAWNSMISAYGYHNYSNKTIEIFEKMIECRIRPTKTTFINLLSACSHLGLVGEGQWYYKHMFDEFGVEPETEHHVCMVDMLGRSGKLVEAYEFIENLEGVIEPGIWGALLSASGYYGDLDMGKKVAEILFRLEPDNVGYYVLLFNMYVGAGRWSEAAELRMKIEDKGLKKGAGVSLIDVGFG